MFLENSSPHMLTTAGQATDRWWALPGSSLSTSALQLLAGRPRDNSATGSPIHLHYIYLSTYLHHEAYVARCEYYRPYRAVTRPQAMLVCARDYSDSVHFQHLHCLSSIYTLWCMLGSILDSPNYLYPTREDHVWKWRKKPRHCWIVHVCFLQAHWTLNIKYGPI